MEMSFAGSILIVEDDPQQLRLYAQVLGAYRLTCVSNGTAALEVLRAGLPDLILLDQVLAGGERGLTFLPKLKEVAAHVPIVIISGTLNVREQLEALQGPGSAHYVIEKPVDIEQLERTVETALCECGLGETVRVLQSLDRAELVEQGERERLFIERLARQHELLKRLRGSTLKPNISDLAGEFHVDRHTIRRDLRDLVQRGQLSPEIYPVANGAD